MSEATAGEASGNTSQTFVTALVTNSALLGVELFAFVLLKNKLSRIYAPRTYLPPPEKRANELPSGPWRWLPAIAFTPPEDIIRKNGLDAYMFLRFLRLMIVTFASFTLVTWLVLLPIDSAKIDGNDADGLAKLSWGNIPASESKRYAAHIVVVYVLTFFVLYLIRREFFHYTRMRQAFLLSKSHSHLAQARTVLITSIPPDLCTVKELRIWASFVPGGIENVWVYRDTRDLNKAFDERLKACKKLEAAESKLLRTAIKARLKRDKQQNHSSKPAHTHEIVPPPEHDNEDIPPATSGSDAVPESPFPNSEKHGHTLSPTSPTRPTGVRSTTSDLERGSQSRRSHKRFSPAEEDRERGLLDDLVPAAKRPKHRLGFLGLWGRKVDTVEWCKSEISRLNAEIPALRDSYSDSAKPLGSAFIQCNLQMGAHVLAQCISYHEPLMMTDKWIQVAPKDVIWANIDDGAYETRARYVTSWIASIAIIVLWFAPVAFVGLLSNVSELCAKVKWLAWICSTPTPVPGIIQGVLPPLFLAILFAILPLILRGLAWYENIPLYSLLSISVYKRYYLFLVVHGFLVVTLSSGITATISGIVSAPAQTVSQLASHLPDANVFFLTWTVTQGLTGAGGALLQIAALLMHFIKKWFLGRTPRQAYEVTFLMPSADFGTVLPRMSLLATIGFAYSVLSPIINGLATLAFVLFYFAWKFLLTWVFDQPDEQETGGLYFPLAIQNLFVGLYIEQICLAALFFLKISSGLVFLAQGILMLVLIAITFTAQIFLQKAFDPLSQYLPMSLATKKMQARYERERRKKEGAEEKKEDDEIDLFDRDRIRSVVRRRIKNPVQALKAEITNQLKRESNPPVEASSSSSPPPIMPASSPSQEIHRALSNRSQASHSSKSSNASKKEARHPVFDPAAPAVEDSDDSGDDGDFDDHGFDHPSTYAEQPWIWLPKDPLGLSQLLVDDLKESGVDASDEGSSMNQKGIVEVSRNPPDEAWTGGHNA